MVTTYNKETYASTSHSKTNAGYGLLCNNEDILCNNEDYDCHGAVVMRDNSHTTTTYNKITY